MGSDEPLKNMDVVLKPSGSFRSSANIPAGGKRRVSVASPSTNHAFCGGIWSDLHPVARQGTLEMFSEHPHAVLTSPCL